MAKKSKLMIPTDLAILNAMFKLYRDRYVLRGSDVGKDPYVTVDFSAIAKRLGVDVLLVRGRVTQSMNAEYSIKVKPEDPMGFFGVAENGVFYTDERKGSVHFPILMSVLASKREDAAKHSSAVKYATISLFVALISVLASIFL